MILVTGGTGRIGRHLISRLLAEKEKVRAVVRSEERAIYLPKGVEPFYADITKKETLRDAFEDVEKVVHLAGSVDFSSSKEKMQEVNVCGTRNILESCPEKLKRFVHCSSISVYGFRPVEIPADERTPTSPDDIYGETKLAAEKEAQSYSSKIPITILRPGVIYGEGFDDAYLAILARLEKGNMPYIGNAENHIPFVHVNDIVESIMLSLKKKLDSGSKYVIVGKESLTQKDIFMMACAFLEVDPPENHVSPGMAKLFAYFSMLKAKFKRQKPPLLPSYINILSSDRIFSIKKSEKELDFKPKVSLEDGIKEMVEYYRSGARKKG